MLTLTKEKGYAVTIILTILSFISAIASGIYAYQTGSVAAESLCIASVLAFSMGLWGMAFGGKFEGEDGTENK